MTMEETSNRYQIPIKVLQEYESWGLYNTIKKVIGAWQYDDSDLENLSMIMTLYDIGFTTYEIETYMRLLLEKGNSDEERLWILNQKRNKILDEIHFKENQLDRLDYLKYEICNHLTLKNKI